MRSTPSALATASPVTRPTPPAPSRYGNGRRRGAPGPRPPSASSAAKFGARPPVPPRPRLQSAASLRCLVSTAKYDVSLRIAPHAIRITADEGRGGRGSVPGGRARVTVPSRVERSPPVSRRRTRDAHTPYTDGHKQTAESICLSCVARPPSRATAGRVCARYDLDLDS